jgi:1-acyl-sn-glycerol-3-phosphate acyltransferase
MASRWRTVAVARPGQVSARLERLALRRLRPPLALLFGPSITGLEHLPSPPFVLVANHSAGMGAAELLSLLVLYLERFGRARPLAAMAHPLCWSFWPVSLLLPHVGAIPSTQRAAGLALAAGVPVLVFPGGDHETLRPFWKARRVDLGGRRGFLRLAARARVPVVPMGIAGSHLTAPVLWRSRRLLPNLLLLPRLVGMRRWGLTLLGVAGAWVLSQSSLPRLVKLALAWAWLTSPFVFLPILPGTITFRVGAPLLPDQLFLPDDERHERALQRVQGELQRLMDEARRATPRLGFLRRCKAALVRARARPRRQ